MHLWIVIFLLGATAVTMVDCGCYYLNLLGLVDDLGPMCAGWWDKANGYDIKDDDRAGCLFLIERKCPDMLTLKNTFKRVYDPENERYETWEIEGVATDKTGKEMKYYFKDERRVCSYEKGNPVDCGYWWGVAAIDKADNSIKQHCIDSILQNCPKEISIVKEESDVTPHPCSGDYLCRTITYKNEKGDKVSFNDYETW